MVLDIILVSSSNSTSIFFNNNNKIIFTYIVAKLSIVPINNFFRRCSTAKNRAEPLINHIHVVLAYWEATIYFLNVGHTV
jgi:hypothetical protein